MMLFLQIVLAVILVIVLLVAGVAFWLKRKFRDFAADIERRAPHIPPFDARIRLSATSDEESYLPDEQQAVLQSAWTRLAAAGFERLGLFDGEGSNRYFILGRHPSGVAGMVSTLGDACLTELFGVGTKGRLLLVSPSPLFEPIDNKSLEIRILDGMEPARTLREITSRESFHSLSLHQYVLVYERLHAACMDGLLAMPPSAALVNRWVAFQGNEPLAEGDLKDALDYARYHYDSALHEALLDNAKKALKLDADTWGRIADRSLILTRDTDFEDLANMFEDELAEALVDQLESQNMSVRQALSAANRRLPRSEQLVPVIRVHRPATADILVQALYLDSIDLEDAPEIEAGPGLKRFLYQSRSPDDEAVRSSLVAVNAADARTQLQRMGHTDVKILSMNQDPVQPMVDMDLYADDMIAMQSASLPKVVLKIVMGNWFLWAPFLAWAAYSLYVGPPYQWSDYLGFVLAVVSLAGTLYLALPSVLYNALQEAQSWGRAKQAKRYHTLLRRIGATRFVTRAVMDMEEAKILAGMGRTNEGLKLLDEHKADLSELSYLTYRYQIYDAANDHANLIDTQHRMVELAPDNKEYKVELALSLLRYTNRTLEAEKLLKGLHPHDCSEVFVVGLRYAQGLLLGFQDQHGSAVNRLQEALEGIQAFRSPIVNALAAEIRGYIAVFLLKSGDREQAGRIWDTAAPRLEAVKARHVLSLYPTARQARSE